MSTILPIRLFVMAALLAAPATFAGDATGDTPVDTPVEAKVEVKVEPKGDAASGKALFTAGCSTCHGVTKEDNSLAMVGPSLFGVVGRKAGSVKSLLGGSENLRKYGVIWSAETLNEFLINPDAKAPGTAMIGMLTEPQQRADMIAYLSTLKK